MEVGYNLVTLDVDGHLTTNTVTLDGVFVTEGDLIGENDIIVEAPTRLGEVCG